MKQWKEYLEDIRNGLLSLIPKYKKEKDPIDLYNIKRLLQWRKDIFNWENVKKGKTIVRDTEPYDQGYK